MQIPPNLMNTEEEKIRNETLQLYILFVEGESVRSIAKSQKIPFETLRDRFKKFLGSDYAIKKGAKGTLMQVVQEYLDKLPQKHKQEVLKWYIENRSKIISDSIEVNKKQKPRVYTDEVIAQDKILYHRFPYDLRDAFFLSTEKIYKDT